MKHQTLANTIKGLAMDGVQKANSGHPGMPMGMADVASVLWTRFLKIDPAEPRWMDRDRLVISAGHGSMLLYSFLHLSGYEDFPMSELQQFRQWGSRTAGHPESHLSNAIETTTGPLGQGISNAVGMAIAERWLAARFNREGHTPIDHHTYVIAGDGDLMEGVASEACSLGAHLGLSKLVVLYDDNGITIDGSTDLAFTEDVGLRFSAYGWHVQAIDGHDPVAVERAIAAARENTTQPSIICCRTHIGHGSPNKQDKAAAHGSPLGRDEIALVKAAMGWPEEAFYVPEEVRAGFSDLRRGWAEEHATWRAAYGAYREAFPELAAQLEAQMRGELPDGLADALPRFEIGKALASRAASHKVINALAPVLPGLLGGSADLTGSNNTDIDGGGAIQRDTFHLRNLHFGVREHAMGAICNGLALHGGVIPYGGTFLVFQVFTHDSVFLGEDGPTHQPVEHLAALRAIPRLQVIRPADANEVAAAWKVALESTDAPTAIALTRQKIPTLAEIGDRAIEGVARGAYTIVDVDGKADALLLASGSEVHVAVEAAAQLSERGIQARVVSFPCWERFEAQDQAWKESVLPADVPVRVVVEAGIRQGWERYAGPFGAYVTIDDFGHSAPDTVLAEKLGFTPAHVASVTASAIARFRERLDVYVAALR
jgi:transketolase